MRFLAGFTAAIVLLIVGALTVVSTGAYNIAASEPHLGPVRWALDTTMRNSVKRRADDVTVPPRFTDQQVREGFKAFDDTCRRCHGAPGVERSDWAEGLRPKPPDLADKASHWTSAELFWIVKHGIKMTAMPAFGRTHEDGEVWTVVAFVEQLPTLTADDYSKLRETTGAQAAGASSGH